MQKIDLILRGIELYALFSILLTLQRLEKSND